MAEGDKKETRSDILDQKFLETRSIMVTGPIDKESAEKVIKNLLILESISDEPIKVFINSPGGDVDAGLAIYDMVRFIKNRVYMIGMGLVASAATIVLVAVAKEDRYALPNSSYLIHQPMSRMEGVATDIEIYTTQLEKTRERLNKIISDSTSQPIEVVEKDTDRDYWLDAQQALSYGLISKIVEKREQI
ncbi:MAG: ATP-dependent Clp protease proteolytic subunit [Sphaerochaetaceae bacterium]